MKQLLFSLTLLVGFSTSSIAQKVYKPVKWKFSKKKVKGKANDYDLIFTATIDQDWSVYSITLDPDDGPYPTEFNFESLTKGIKRVGKVRESKLNRVQKYDKVFEMKVVKFGNKAIFKQRVRLPKTGFEGSVKGYLTFMTCTDERCLPTTDVDFKFNFRKKSKKRTPKKGKAVKKS